MKKTFPVTWVALAFAHSFSVDRWIVEQNLAGRE